MRTRIFTLQGMTWLVMALNKYISKLPILEWFSKIVKKLYTSLFADDHVSLANSEDELLTFSTQLTKYS